MEEGCTNVDFYNFQYKWRIKNYSLCQKIYKTTEFIDSPTFTTGPNANGKKWHLCLYPNGDRNECADFISIYLNYETTDKSKVIATGSYYIVNSTGQQVNQFNGSLSTYDATNSSWGYDKFYEKKLLLEKAKELLPNDCLTIICKMTVIGSPAAVNCRSPISVPKCQLVEDLERLFEDEESCDFTFKVRDEEFQVHKAILKARSPVFAAMFRHEMKEQEENYTDIVDVEPKVFKELLRFIYTDKPMNLNELAEDLLAVADKYALDRLKGLCAEVISEKIQIENAADLYILADSYNAKDLAKYVGDFINKHKSVVLDTEGFKSLEKSHSQLVAKLFIEH